MKPPPPDRKVGSPGEGKCVPCVNLHIEPAPARSSSRLAGQRPTGPTGLAGPTGRTGPTTHRSHWSHRSRRSHRSQQVSQVSTGATPQATQDPRVPQVPQVPQAPQDLPAGVTEMDASSISQARPSTVAPQREGLTLVTVGRQTRPVSHQRVKYSNSYPVLAARVGVSRQYA